ncbi:MAG: HAD family hydrolase [Oscillospiraceae bacterium]|nr:HAD family hydrolase [Oscillospiraceae bacterium]
MQYQNYIFDLYGTLVDIRTNENSPLLWKRTSLWYKEHGALWQPKELWNCYLDYCHQEQSVFSDLLAEIELRSVFAALFREKGVDPDPLLVEETARFFRICSVKKLRLYPWVLPTFSRLRENGRRLFLLSNAQACFTESELRALSLEDQFDGILLSSDVGVKKPSPKIMQTLLDRFQLTVSDCLMIGNDPFTDIAVASSFGMDSLYLKTATSPQNILPENATFCILDEDYSKLNLLLQ